MLSSIQSPMRVDWLENVSMTPMKEGEPTKTKLRIR